MNLIDLQQKLKDQIRAGATELFGVTLDQLSAETPPKPELGDVAFPVAFELAKLVKQATGDKVAPRAVAEKLKIKLEELPEVARIEIAGPGYVERPRICSRVAPAEPCSARRRQHRHRWQPSGAPGTGQSLGGYAVPQAPRPAMRGG